MAKSKNIFVIDTCVLLHDPECIFKFKEHDIYIPLACIDDLDEIKIKRDNVGWSAREVFRIFDQFDIQQLTKGIVINESGGKLFIYNNEAPLMRGEKPTITRMNSDNELINAASQLKLNFPKRKVAIVSKDTGLRVRATSWGCEAENYKSDLLNDEDLYKGYRVVHVDNLDDWNYISEGENHKIEKLICKDQLKDISYNEFICFKYGNSSLLCCYKKNEGIVFLNDKKKKDSFSGIVAKNMEQRFALEALSDDSIPLVCLTGPAGSGKSLLSIAVGLEKVDIGQYERVIIMKPLVPVGGKDIGFLPGDKIEKISAWLGPFKDNITQLSPFGRGNKRNTDFFEGMIDEGIIEVEALTFIQGRSITNSFIILDECLTGDSMVYCSDGSLKKIEDIQNGENVLSFDTKTQSWSNNYIKSKFNRTAKEYLKIHTSKGCLECTMTHPMWVYENGTHLIKKQAKDINLNDLIPCATNFCHIVKNDINVEEAGMAALILTDGHVEKSLCTMKIDMSKDKDWLKYTFEQFSKKLFTKFSSKDTNARNNMICRVYGKKEICDFIDKFEIKSGKKSNTIQVPHLIWNAPIESVKKFIQICFDSEGDVNISFPSNQSKPNIKINFSSTSKNFTKQIQALLLKFNIDSHIYISSSKNNRAMCYKVSIVGGYMCNLFFNLIGFSIERKQRKHDLIKDFSFECPYIYPKTVGLDLYESLESDGRWKDKNKYYKGNMNNDMQDRINHKNGSAIAYSTLEKIQTIAEKINYDLNNVITCSKINKIELISEEIKVYDFEVEINHTFVVNGLVSSNCENVSPKEARMVVERCGKNSKVVLLGDLSQIENPYLDKYSCGLAHAVNGSKNHEVAASIAMTKVERSPLSEAAGSIFKIRK